MSFFAQIMRFGDGLTEHAPVAGWQTAQVSSFDMAPPEWFAPVVQLILSWQEPQAAREGTVFQLSTCASAAAGVASLAVGEHRREGGRVSRTASRPPRLYVPLSADSFAAVARIVKEYSHRDRRRWRALCRHGSCGS